MDALIDTNILIYRYDYRFPEKQEIATASSAVASWMVQCVCRIRQSLSLSRRQRARFAATSSLQRADALREAAELLKQFVVLYPNEMIVREAVRGCAAYQLSWFDAHLCAYAEHYGIPENLTEDFQHDRLYGSVRSVNPFADPR